MLRLGGWKPSLWQAWLITGLLHPLNFVLSVYFLLPDGRLEPGTLWVIGLLLGPALVSATCVSLTILVRRVSGRPTLTERRFLARSTILYAGCVFLYALLVTNAMHSMPEEVWFHPFVIFMFFVTIGVLLLFAVPLALAYGFVAVKVFKQGELLLPRSA